MSAARLLALGTLVVALEACRTAAPIPEGNETNPAKGVVHKVEPGQTLWRIAQAYGVTVQELAEVNDLDNPTDIKVGQGLWIPRALRVLHIEPAPGMRPQAKVAEAKVASRDLAKEEEPAPKVEVHHARFSWPVKGILFSRFGVRDGAQHDGIDISAPKGTPILAADGGEVLYSGVQRGYGNIVLVKHADGLITIYAHCEENEVKQGERVKRGQEIARVGETGRATGPHLHFEVREDRVPRNPLFFLP